MKKQPSRPYQFSLWQMLATVTLLACVLGLGRYVNLVGVPIVELALVVFAVLVVVSWW